MLKAAIFDLNGIFVQSPKLSERFEKDFGVAISTFLPKLSEIMDAVRKPGASSAFTYWKPALEEWKIDLNEDQFWNYWFGSEKVSEKMVSFSKELRRRGIKVFILSNNFRERAEYYAHYPWIHEAVDKVYFSWQTGYIKPDTKAWSELLREQGLSAGECIYFDDQEKNLIAAREVGIPSFPFTTEEDLEGVVRALLPA